MLFYKLLNLNDPVICFRIGDFSIDKFAKRVEQLGFDKFPEFSQYGKMTFFLPIDRAFNVGDKSYLD